MIPRSVRPLSSLFKIAALASAVACVPIVHAQTSADFKVYRGTQVPPEVERIYEKGLKFLTSFQNDLVFDRDFQPQVFIIRRRMMDAYAISSAGKSPLFESPNRRYNPLWNTTTTNSFLGRASPAGFTSPTLKRPDSFASIGPERTRSRRLPQWALLKWVKALLQDSFGWMPSLLIPI